MTAAMSAAASWVVLGAIVFVGIAFALGVLYLMGDDVFHRGDDEEGP